MRLRDLSPAPPVSPRGVTTAAVSQGSSRVVPPARPSRRTPASQQVSEDLGSCLSPHAVCQPALEGACKPASQSEPLLFAPPRATRKVTGTADRRKSPELTRSVSASPSASACQHGIGEACPAGSLSQGQINTRGSREHIRVHRFIHNQSIIDNIRTTSAMHAARQQSGSQ
jgi:hypothetical protein